MTCIVTTIAAVRPLGDNLSVVTIAGVEHEVVANRREDGSFRWHPSEPCVYVPEEATVPDDVLKERGYWNDEKGIGLLGGKKGNRVKMRRFGPETERIESRGLLFAIDVSSMVPGDFKIVRGEEKKDVAMGDDVSDFLGITSA